ncbi:MAG: integrase [Deltaproteobacteria bacterium]|nr:integrase [Deltaproteobacteria bacterium]
MTADGLLRLVQSFFQEYLQRVRGASPHTVISYRDSLRLFLCFLADASGKPVSELDLDDVVAGRVTAFLEHLEAGRGNSIPTRNLRLAAVRSFAEHLLRHDPTRADQYRRILDVPTKKARKAAVVYLEPEQVQTLLHQPNPATPLGWRDHALMLFLYNTGARVGEALAVRWRDIQQVRPAHVRLHGKGSKDRLCPLWGETVAALSRLSAANPEHQVFVNARGGPLTRDGVAYILRKHTAAAARELPALERLRVTPHVLRHSCAVALLQAGIDITVIRDYLGHASVATTSRYTSTNLQMKREVLDAFWKRAGLAPSSAADWAPTPDVLAFLERL